MSPSWFQRKSRLQELLKSRGDEDEDGLALDRLLHGQSVIGKTAKTSEIDTIRFQNQDLQVLGTLEYGQFGVIDVVTCRLDGRVYVRKTIEKSFALRTREQCSPQFERDILLQARKTESCWVPHLLCAFHTPTHLNLVMDYAEGGTLWDVLESSPLDGRISESDLKWWIPQAVSAIHWCHSQGFAHRDIKPHNFVLTPTAHVLLIDFGSAAPLQTPARDGSQQIPKQYCLVPCGTCDYISPEILKAHEQALVALEIDESEDIVLNSEDEIYGRETDWWSLGAMLYEMTFGVAPFFAEDVRRTYFKIMDHRKSLRFSTNVPISAEYQDMLSRLLTDAEFRLGRQNIQDITSHPFFNGVGWNTLLNQKAPADLHLPQFTYSAPDAQSGSLAKNSEEFSQPFAFSALFQSSVASSSPGISFLRGTPSPHIKGSDSLSDSTSASSFIGFSWGPAGDAFPDTAVDEPSHTNQGLSPSMAAQITTPHLFRTPRTWLTPTSQARNLAPFSNTTTPNPLLGVHAYSTPIRPTTHFSTPYHAQTLPRTMSTARRTVMRRAVSDREAMKQLVDCVGMSARKKVLESGRKPRILNSFASKSNRSSTTSGTIKKELRFLTSSGKIPHYEYDLSHSQKLDKRLELRVEVPGTDTELESGSATDTSTDETGSEAPPSPSPSPRPGSAMSMMSMVSRRSGTPTITTTFSQRLSVGTPNATHHSTISAGWTPRSRTSSGGSIRRMRSMSGSSGTAEHSTLEELEAKHASIMADISVLEERLGFVSQFVRE